MRTSLRSPMRAPLKTRVPVARNTSSPIVAPEMLAIGPTRVWSPMWTAFAALARIRAFSMTITFAPSVIGPPSAVITAPCSTWQSAPIETSPLITAVGRDDGVGMDAGPAPRGARTARALLSFC